MGAIFPMAPLKIRKGFVRKREKEAKPVRPQPEAILRVEPSRVVKAVASNSAEGDDR
jgi:hypothetical protein